MPESLARRRRFAVDPRLLIGLLLVVGSVVGVVGIVSAADSRTLVYAAAGPLAPGDRIDAGDIVERSVALDGTDPLYLAPDDLPDGGLVITQSVRDGELVPLSAVGSVAGLRTTAVVIESTGPLSSAVVPGSGVDVWAAPAVDQSEQAAPFGPPSVLVAGAIVVRVLEDDGLVASGGVAVEVLVPRSRVARLLHSIANADALAIVPSGLPWEG
jgi:hypothetical protein